MNANGGRGAAAHKRNPPPPDRILGISGLQSSAAAPPPLELSEQDIFNTPSGSSSTSSSHCSSPARGIHNHSRGGHHGILAALNDSGLRSRSGSDPRPVFNHKASTSASLSSSSSTSPSSSVRSASMMIPRRPPPPTAVTSERTRFQPRSAPVNVPKMAARRSRVLEDIASDQEEEEEMSGVVLPPHEVVASRHTPMLACSVLEGAGRTLKGRDLRQVRNAIWRRTGFLD